MARFPCGRKINYITTLDDQGTPNGDLAAIQQLVQQHDVFGIAPALSPFIESGGVYINQRQVPTVGWGVSPSFCPPAGVTNTYIFGFNGCLVQFPPTYEVNIVGPATARAFQLQGKSIQGLTSAVIGATTTSPRSRGLRSWPRRWHLPALRPSTPRIRSRPRRPWSPTSAQRCRR